MTYLEWLKEYDKSHITHPTRQDVWDGAWNYQQAKIDEILSIVDKALIQINNHKDSCIARRGIKRMSASDSEIAEIDVHETNMHILAEILRGVGK